MKVAAVMATRNRLEILKNTLKSLTGENVDCLIVSDNESKDGTKEFLEKWSKKKGRRSLQMGGNLGNAEGVRKAMEVAFKEEKCDVVWILDDDSPTKTGALEELKKVMADGESHESIPCPLVISEDGELSFPIQIISNFKKKIISRRECLSDEKYIEVAKAWLGILISRKIWEDVGEVDGRLFIRGEDEEYPRRISQKGYRFILAVNAEILHSPIKTTPIPMTGGRLGYEKGLPPWKRYYLVRNKIYVLKKFNTFFVGEIKSLMTVGVQLGVCIFEKKRMLINMLFVFRGCIDGFKGRLGARVLP